MRHTEISRRIALRKTLRSWTLRVAPIFVLAGIMCAQDATNPLNVGFPTNGEFDGSDFDSVQTTNGNLRIEIPLWSDKGRDLGVAFKYVYDNKGWRFRNHCDRQGVCTDTVEVEPGGTMTWTLAGSYNYGVSYKIVTQTCGNVQDLSYTNYVLREPDGTKHHFDPDPAIPGGNSCWGPLGTMYASDGSGWILHVDTSNGVFQSAVRKDGMMYTGQVEDTNGNELIPGTAPNPGTDTLGRAINTDGSYYDYSGAQRSFQTTRQTVAIQTALCAFSGADYCFEYSGNFQQLQTVTLPNGMTYTFTYDQGSPTHPYYGEPLSVTLPTGGTITWGWGGPGDESGRVVVSRQLSGDPGPWSYAPCASNLPPGYTSAGKTTDPAGNDTVFTCSYYSQPWTAGLPNFEPGTAYVTSKKYYQGSSTSGTLIKTVQTDYQTANNTPAILPIHETTTWNQQNLVTRTETDWDSYAAWSGAVMSASNPIERREYAFGTAPNWGSLVRTTHNNYLHLTNSAYKTANILDLPTSKVVYSGSSQTGTIVAQTTYAYDGVTTTSTSGTPAPNHDYTNFSTSNNIRGNLTQTSQGLFNGSTWTWLNITNTYDDLGNKLSTKDPKNNTTKFSYVDNWADSNCTVGSNTFAYLTQTTDALLHQTKHSYFRCMGLLASTQDQNDINSARVGTTFTYDLLNRPLTVNYPDGGQTTSSYVDTNPLSVTQDKLVSSGLYVQHTSVFDGLGRLQQTQFNDPDCNAGLIKMDHAFGYTSGASKFTKISTPYCNTPDSTYGLMSTTNYDALDRVTSVVQTDGSTLTTTYSGNSAGLTSTVTDEAGKKRTNQTDALGRLTAVFEDPTSLNYETDYGYDTLDNLTSVTQKGGAASGSWRTRSFTYDSLSRLTCAANPEVTPGLSTVNPASCPTSYAGTYTNGTIGYSYDADGNLIMKTAPAPNQTSTSSTVTTNYSYDVVNRLTQKSYAGSPATATAKYGYDGVALTGCTTTPPTLTPADSNPVGYRSSMCDGSGATSWSHDPLGRVLKDQRIINGTSAVNKNVQYTYYLDGELNKLTYPSGRVLSYTLKTGGTCNGGSCTSGRPVSAGDGTTNYVSAAVYAPHGALASFTNDVSIHAGFSYNSRLQPLQMAFGTGTLPSLTGTTCPTGASIMHRLYDFHLGNGNNGNVQVINNCKDSNRTQNFFYDNLNRITQAYTTGNSPLTTSWGETFTIDAWGNLTNKGPVSGKTNTENLNASPASSKNQLNGFCNDAAGNLVLNAACPTGTFTPTYSYDIENRLSSTNGWTYVYDGDGERVKKCNSCGTSAGGTLYWPSSAADVVLETDLAGTRKYEYMFLTGQRIARRDGSNPPYYYFSDHLKSTSVVSDNTGAIQDESDYFPYGAQIVISNLQPQNYKFSGRENDAESGLYLWGSRYLSGSLGRFQIPDRLTASTIHSLFSNPQNWNLYGYAHNNPLAKTDLGGLLTIIVPGTWYSPKDWNTNSAFVKQVSKTFHENALVLNQDFGWSGGNTKGARARAAAALNDIVKHYQFKPGEQLNIVAHSHGGNVAFEASKTISHKIDNLVTLGTPIRTWDYQPNMANINNLVNVYSYNDGVQTSGSGLSIVSADRTLPEEDGVTNVEAPEAKGHSDLWQNPDVWKNQAVPNLNLPETMSGTHSMQNELDETVQRVEEP